MSKEKEKVHHSTGIMNKMRDKMPVIIIILIIAFLATIIFEWGMNYLGMNNQNFVFAKVNGEEIKAQDYDLMVQQRVQQMREQNNGKDVDDATLQSIRDQVWQEMLQQTLVKQELKKLGIEATNAEVLDWIYQRPETLPEPILRNFKDSTGVFNMAAYQQALTLKSPEATTFWNQVENYLREMIVSQKLQSTIASSVIVTEGDVLQRYKELWQPLTFQFAFLDVNSITDTNVFAVNDQELKDYYEKNKFEFKQQEAVKLKYIIFPDNPTAEDSAQTKKVLAALSKEFKNVQEADSALIKFVNFNSATPYNNEFQKPNAIGKGALGFLFEAKPGDVSEVIIDQDGYKVVRLLESKDGTDTYVKASHILVNFGTDTADAKKKADEILARVKAGEDFGTLASQLSQEPNANQSRGELGWFGKGTMVKEFEDAAYNNAPGSIIGPVKTTFGYHIIKVEGKSNKEFRFAELKETVKPSNRTRELAKTTATDFMNDVQGGQNFDSLAKFLNFPVAVSPEITKDGTFPLVNNNRNLVKWAFDSKVGSIHTPVKVQGGYALFQIVEKLQEGYKNFDSIKVSVLKPKVVLEKKFAALKNTALDLKTKIQGNDLTTLLNQLPGLKVEKIDSMKTATPDPKMNNDMEIGYSLLQLSDGTISDPIRTQRGIYIINMINNPPLNQQDYIEKAPNIRKELMMQKQQMAVQEWLQNLQTKADIEDNRDMFF